MSQYYYWNVLTVEKRTIMLADAVRVEYDKKKKKSNGDTVEVVKAPTTGNISDILGY